MDRISELPVEILHQILSPLSTKGVFQVAVLSKPLFKACSMNLHLNFAEDDFKNYKCCTVVSKTLLRYICEDLHISTFKLCLTLPDQTAETDDMDTWVDIITQKKVSRFVLLLKGAYRYILSDSVFAMESLEELELSQCIILRQEAAFEDVIKCSNLKSLTLSNVIVSESALHSLFSCCPQITKISLEHCHGFSTIHASDLPNLLSLHFFCCQFAQVHIVDAPKLSSLILRSSGEILLGSCQNVRRVEFVNATIDDTILVKLIQQLPFIKELILDSCKYLKHIKISSSTLEFCHIGNCGETAILDVPKLLSLVLSCHCIIPLVSFERVSNQCRISIPNHIIFDGERIIDLRRSLSGIIGSTDHHLTLEVENLILHDSYSFKGSYSTFFDVVFWTCWPKSLTVKNCEKKFKKFLLPLLLQRRQWRKIKCTWKEYFMNSQIDYIKWKDESWVTLDRKMLTVNPDIIKEIKDIRFTPTQAKEKNEAPSNSSNSLSCKMCIPLWRTH